MTEGTPPTNPPRTGEKKYWLDRPENVDKIYWGVIIVCAALFLGDAFYHKHPYFSMEKVFGFYGIFGFVACVGLVLAAKELRKLLMRGEDYYDKTDEDAGSKH
jgi:hypothetical protein